MTTGLGSCHSVSHRHLLVEESPFGPEADVDAIIVPTIRPVPYLRHAMDVAEKLGCVLIVLCSRRANPQKIITEGTRLGAALVAIEVPPPERPDTPPLLTSKLLRAPGFRRFGRRSDVSLKRNLGLLLARMAGWSRIVFLDDDIEVPNPQQLKVAAKLLDKHEAVGLYIDGFPDNSVVCHAHREAGGTQDTFIGTGALALDPVRTISFFPDIYNEDWFYLLDDVRLRPAAVVGAVRQADYDPFAHPDRARAEEFGDVLAEGIFGLLDRGRRVRDADAAYWEDFLGRRQRFIDDVRLRTLRQPETPDRDRRLNSLSAASGRLKLINPDLCTRYLKAWRSDRSRWRNHVNRLPENAPIDEALKRLGLSPHAWASGKIRTTLASATYAGSL